MRLPSDDLHALGKNLGFLSLGVCDAGPPETIDAYRAWLDAGMDAEMAYLRRHAEAKADPANLLPGVRSVIAAALAYNQPNSAMPGEPRIARYARGRDYHKVLGAKLRSLRRSLQALHPEAGFRICVDSAPLLEREYAHRAGLGWFGKNTCLIDSRYGSWFVLGFLLTTLEFEPDRPSVGGCGTCTRCVDACPTGAIVRVDGRWSVDSRRCISYLTIEKRGPFSDIERRSVGEWTFGCDVCQEVCPFNAARSSQPARAAETDATDFKRLTPWPSLKEMVLLDRDEWDRLSRGSAVRRAGFEGLRRNAAANLDNAAG